MKNTTLERKLNSTVEFPVKPGFHNLNGSVKAVCFDCGCFKPIVYGYASFKGWKSLLCNDCFAEVN